MFKRSCTKIIRIEGQASRQLHAVLVTIIVAGDLECREFVIIIMKSKLVLLSQSDSKMSEETFFSVTRDQNETDLISYNVIHLYYQYLR